MIKHFVLFMALAFSCLSYAQNDISPKFQISPLTEIMLKKYYSEEEIKEISNNEVKLKMIDYDYSKSFEILNQDYSNEQLLKIDVGHLKSFRKKEEDTFVVDPNSGLQLKLHSFEKIRKERSKFTTMTNSSVENSKKMKKQ